MLLQTERLLLADPEPADLPRLSSFFSPGSSFSTYGPAWEPDFPAVLCALPRNEESMERRAHFFWKVLSKDSNEWLGVCGFCKKTGGKIPETGDSSVHCQGDAALCFSFSISSADSVCAEALHEIFAFAFYLCEVERLLCRFPAANRRMERFVRECGMERFNFSRPQSGNLLYCLPKVGYRYWPDAQTAED